MYNLHIIMTKLMSIGFYDRKQFVSVNEIIFKEIIPNVINLTFLFLESQ